MLRILEEKTNTCKVVSGGFSTLETFNSGFQTQREKFVHPDYRLTANGNDVITSKGEYLQEERLVCMAKK